MRRLYLTTAMFLLAAIGFAQNDTIPSAPDTIKVGNFIIVKKDKNNRNNDSLNEKKQDKHYSVDITIGDESGMSNDNESYDSRRHRNTSTNWFILDLGFANLRDKTSYGSPEANAYLHANGGADFTSADMDLNNLKSSNVNLWFFMQKRSIIDRVVNIKYGLGLEMYNYRYSTNISYHNNPAYVFRDTINFSKNKLAADYITVPFMLNFDTNPHSRKGLSFGFGVSAGYLYNSRNKQKSDERGKQKTKGDFDLDPWRLAYVAEIGIGPVRLYGSYSLNALHKNGLVQYPYAVGIRLSNW